MIAAGSFEFALARMHARLGRRPPEGAWRSIEHSREIAPILDLCRETSLQAVVKELPAACDLHAVDEAVRGGWRRTVAEAQAWMPADFAAALAWCRVVPLLPALAHLARGEDPAPWMRADPDLAEVAAADAAQRAAAIAQGFLAPLGASWKIPGKLAQAWNSEWDRRLPPAAMAGTALASLARDLSRHLARFHAAATHEAPQMRRDLEARLVACFRRNPLEPAAAFAWLGLSALDLERLRGELARRLAFPRALLVT
jgi:hypothetical protein